MWAAGNVIDPAAAINADLIAADTNRAVEQRRDPFTGPSEARVAERVLGGPINPHRTSN